MPHQQCDSPLQTFLRVCVMVGAVVVGGMAWKLYGPPIEQVLEFAAQLNKAAHASDPEEKNPVGKGEPSIESEAPEWQGTDGQALQSVVPMHDSMVQATSGTDANLEFKNLLAIEPLNREAEVDAPEQDLINLLRADLVGSELLAELKRLGAKEEKLTTWGADGEWRRFRCSILLPSGFRRHFDAIEHSSTEAISAVLQEVRDYRLAMDSRLVR